MSGFKWETSRKKSLNVKRGTLPDLDYQPLGEDLLCVITERKLSPESRKKHNRMTELLRHLKSQKYVTKNTQQQIDVIREIHSHHVALFEDDDGYYTSITHRQTRLILQRYEHWLKRNSADRVFIP